MKFASVTWLDQICASRNTCVGVKCQLVMQTVMPIKLDIVWIEILLFLFFWTFCPRMKDFKYYLPDKSKMLLVNQDLSGNSAHLRLITGQIFRFLGTVCASFYLYSQNAYFFWFPLDWNSIKQLGCFPVAAGYVYVSFSSFLGTRKSNTESHM